MKYNFQNLLFENRFIKNNKKARKLVNNPNLFFYDFFRKRIDYSPTTSQKNSNIQDDITSSHILLNKNINYKHDTKNLCLAIVKNLALNTQLVFCQKRFAHYNTSSPSFLYHKQPLNTYSKGLRICRV